MAQSPPEGSPQLIPYLYYEDADSALEFLETAFGFVLDYAHRNPQNDKVLTSQLSYGAARVWVGPGMVPFGTQGTPDPDFVSAMLYVYVEDVDKHYAQAVASGARVREEPAAHFGGNRQYTVSDPGGHRWTFAQPIENA